jgi:hypothetical protein
MSEKFDDFMEGRNNRARDEAMLAKETMPEWIVLKGLASQFALDGKEFGGHNFEWAPYPAPYPEFLRLDQVAATFLHHGTKNGIPLECQVHITRRPLKSGEVWISGDSPLEPIEWSLVPEMRDGTVLWRIPELGKTFSSAELAEKIAIELSRYQEAYVEAYRPLL